MAQWGKTIRCVRPMKYNLYFRSSVGLVITVAKDENPTETICVLGVVGVGRVVRGCPTVSNYEVDHLAHL